MMDSTATQARKPHHMAKYRECKSAFDFSADLEKAALALGVESAREAAVSIALTLIGKVTVRTPVDTGRARANWFLAEGAPRIETTESMTPENHGAVSLTGRSVIFITNSLPYIVPLEYGHSAQAPSGMLRIAIAETMAEIK
jgi:hypothetical protein